MVCLGSSVPARRMPTPEWPHPYRVGYPGTACPPPPCDNPIVRSSHPVRVWRRRPTAMSKNASHGRAHLGCVSGEHRSHRERRSAAPTGTCSARLWWKHKMQRRARGARRAPRGHSVEIPQDDASGWPAAAPGTRSKLLDVVGCHDPTARKSTPRVSATTHNMCRLHLLRCED
jgi:hypothetical protein